VLEHLADTLVGLGGALEVSLGSNDLLDGVTLSLADRLLRSLGQLLDGLLVIPQILLAANKDDGKTVAEVKNLGNPLLLDVLEGVGRVDREANQDDVRVRVREGTETIVILLAGSIPKGQLDVLAINLDVGDVVLEDGRDVNLRESALGKHDEQTGLSAGSIADDNQLASDLSHCNV